MRPSPKTVTLALQKQSQIFPIVKTQFDARVWIFHHNFGQWPFLSTRPYPHHVSRILICHHFPNLDTSKGCTIIIYYKHISLPALRDR